MEELGGEDVQQCKCPRGCRSQYSSSSCNSSGFEDFNDDDGEDDEWDMKFLSSMKVLAHFYLVHDQTRCCGKHVIPQAMTCWTN